MTSPHRLLLACAVAIATIAPGAALAHELFDHEAPDLGGQPAPTTSGFQSGGEGAEWEFVDSIATGNPHTDLDFFTRDGETYLSAGTLGVAPNGGGQTIVKLTEGDEVAPELVSQAPTASCVSNEAAALGLQHDAEASPKPATAPLNTFNPYAAIGDAQIVVDATDARGRCHDSQRFGGDGLIGLIDDRPGGLEIIDVTDVENPVEIGLTSHIGESHTVNIDPKRPHIAYSVTSDSTGVTEDGGENGEDVRSNETEGSSSEALDGFEVVDMSSCMNFPPGTSVDAKRLACRPEVFRYRWPTVDMAQGHTRKTSLYGCHELEVYPNDRLTCGSGQALIVFDMAGAFDDMGTPDDYTDDKPRGDKLPCRTRESASSVFTTGAFVIDCVDGLNPGTSDLIVSQWLQYGAPSLSGVKHVGTVFHMGRGAGGSATPTYDSTEDIDFNHESEYSQSGNLLIATDERGGGVAPPGASCSQVSDNKAGNGGVHFYRADKLMKETPEVRDAEGNVDTAKSAEIAHQAYARTPEGEKAIYRAPVRTGGQATVCTAHVFQQIPGQNRIFMAWYSQGTQVLDFTENPDGTVEIEEAAYFIPANANEWVSDVFKAQENADGTFTYWGAALDFNLGERGRNAVDIWKVTLPAPPKPADGPGLLPERVQKGEPVRDPQTGQTVAATTQAGAPSCVPARSIRSAKVRTRGRRLSFAFTADTPVQVDLFRQSRGGTVTGERLVKRFKQVSGTINWNGRDRRGRKLRDGHYLVRFFAATPQGIPDSRRVALMRRNGKFRKLGRHERRDTCGLLRRWKLYRPVFGGRTGKPLVMSFRFAEDTRASLVVRRGRRVVKRFREQTYTGGVLHRKRLSRKLTRRLKRGRYNATIQYRRGGRLVNARLRATKI